MTAIEIGLWSFPVLLGLIFLRAPIWLAMMLCGLAGMWMVTGSPNIILSKLKSETYTTFSSYSLSIVPIFLLMGHLSGLGGMSRALFKAGEAWLGHLKGGTAMAAIGACAGFGSICGSSLATAATMAQVALPELKRGGYAGGLSTATLAAGGTLGILIPPSVVLVVYATLTEQNIAKLFLAAFVPGLLAALGYMVVIALFVRRHPGSAGSLPRAPMADRLRALVDVWPVMLIFIVVVGGIYTGIFTPTEGASVGALGTGLVAWAAGGLSRAKLWQALMATAAGTAMIFAIVLGAAFFNAFLALTQVPQAISGFAVDRGFGPWTVLVIILVIYLLLGCVMDSLSMILLTIPIFFPVISTMDFGMTPEQTAIWFGILVLIVVEVGLITPPVGLNLFVINAMDRETPIRDTYHAITWFVASDILRVALLVIFPGITLFLLP
ncbi:TRAP transporter large permease [Neotabrizicola shimadae]|uniref:TRAP transporter large permease protein n=1 Tax=Neotabrizicola shimadae TaxID=2807096 RepID=A0A8G1EC35_9RHOB|nr:TRAP transporter large permease [Neotabrizicola shimadae]QYZ70240.1 TRAP transporter large permease [Neotabrizicola shimadae]